MKITKCTDQAKRLKDKGNLFFKEKNYIASIESYTESAKYADFNNGDYSIALANRSAAFFFMSKYEVSKKFIYNKYLKINKKKGVRIVGT